MAVVDYINGLQHIGLPTKVYDETLEFYKSLGFKVAHSTTHEGNRVAFLEKDGLTMETYDSQDAVREAGSLEHMALDVNNIDALFEEVKAAGYKLLTPQIEALDFWDNGVKFFKIEGPNGEAVEFCEKL